MSGFSRMVLGATHNPVVRNLVTRTRPGRAVAGRFVAGASLDEGIHAARSLNRSGMSVSLDLLGEAVHDRATALAARAEYAECINRMGEEAIEGNISVKLTQLGLAEDRDLALEAVHDLARVAAEHGSTVTIDMEDSSYTEATIEVYEDAQSEHGNLGVCLQAYLHRTPEDLERIAPLGGHIRLCKGAYVEPESIAYQRRSDVDGAFARVLERLMGFEGVRPAIATHDDRLIDLAMSLAAGRVAPFEFQMLFGVRPPLQRTLVERGHPLRVYVPYGSQWYPYLTRRMAERPANAWFFVRALTGRG